MAYDEGLAERLRELLPKAVEKKMFGGLSFMERGNMLVGVMGDDLLVRVDPADAPKLLKLEGVRPFSMGGKMGSAGTKGWLFVSQEAVPEEPELSEWVERCRKHAKTLPAK